MGEDITTLEGCTRLSSQRGTGGGMQAADTNALSRETPTGIGGLQAEDTRAPHSLHQLALEGGVVCRSPHETELPRLCTSWVYGTVDFVPHLPNREKIET